MKRTIIYKQVNGLPLKADYYPSIQSNSPLIVYIHGGALIWGSRVNVNKDQVNLYNNAGFAVLSIDYRLAPESKLDEIIEDIQDVFIWLKQNSVAQLGVDVEKIVVVGSSAGGYLSLLSGTFSVRPKAIVSFYGYGDILGDWYTKPSEYYSKMDEISREKAFSHIGSDVISEGEHERFNFYLYCRQQGRWIQEVTGREDLNEPRLRDYCPIYNISSNYPTTLLVHGSKDTDVPYDQSLMMHRSLMDLGVYSKLITVDDAGHGFDREMQDAKVGYVFGEVIRFLKACVS